MARILEAPDGTVLATFPDGTSDEEISAYEGKSTFGQWWQRTLTPPLQQLREGVASGAANLIPQVSDVIRNPFEGKPSPVHEPGPISTAVSHIIPTTPTEALTTAGLVAAPFVAPAAMPAAVARILGAGAGAMGGAGLEGKSPYPAAQEGSKAVLATAAGELLFGAASKLARSVPGAKARISNDDARRYMEALGELSPSLQRGPQDWVPIRGARGGSSPVSVGPGRPMPEEVQATALMRQGAAETETLMRRGGDDVWLPAAQPGAPADVWRGQTQRPLRPASAPAAPTASGGPHVVPGPRAPRGRPLGPAPASQARTASEELLDLASGRGSQLLSGGKEQVTRTIEAITGNPALSIPTLGPDPLTFRAANFELSKIGAVFKTSPTQRTTLDVENIRRYGDVANEIRAALQAVNPAAARLWDAGQRAYNIGLHGLEQVRYPNAFRGGSTVQLNTPALQQRYGLFPEHVENLRRQIGEDAYERLALAARRGGRAGQHDRLPGQEGTLMDATGQLLRQGGGTTTGVLWPLRTALPNLGARYIGRQPYSLPPAAQTALDALLAEYAVAERRR